MIWKKIMPSPFWAGVATLVASMVGIGIFGIPFVFQRSGFGIGCLFLFGVGLAIILANLLYGEIVLRTHTRHQFVGYVHKYLGQRAHWINLVNFWIAFFGAMTAVLIINGGFLSKLLGFFGIESTPRIGATLFVIGISYLVYRGLKTVSKVDFVLMIVFFLIVLTIGFFGIGDINPRNFEFTTGNNWLLPFGVILFSLSGIQGIPLIREVMKRNEKKLKNAIILGTSIPIILYLLFAFFVVGVSGDGISDDAITGIADNLGSHVLFIGALFGFITSGSIFLSLALSFKRTLWEDFEIHEKYGFLLVLIPPYILLFLGITDFISLIGLVGGVAVSIDMILLILVYVQAKRHGDRIPEYSIRIPRWILYLMIFMFALGAGYTLMF